VQGEIFFRPLGKLAVEGKLKKYTKIKRKKRKNALKDKELCKEDYRS